MPQRPVATRRGFRQRTKAYALIRDKSGRRFTWLELVRADGGCHACQVTQTAAGKPGLRVEIVKRPDDMKGFVTLVTIQFSKTIQKHSV
jgi:hypothetical protein